MIRSTKYSYLSLRIGIALVFLWFGIDKFIDPQYWLNAWVPEWTIDALAKIGISGTQFMFINGIFEVLVAISLVTGVFIRIFSFASILFLIGVILTNSLNEVTVRDIGLVGGLLAIYLWPETDNRY